RRRRRGHAPHPGRERPPQKTPETWRRATTVRTSGRSPHPATSRRPPAGPRRSPGPTARGSPRAGRTRETALLRPVDGGTGRRGARPVCAHGQTQLGLRQRLVAACHGSGGRGASGRPFGRIASEDFWPRQWSDGALQGGDAHPASREGELTMPAANAEQSIFLAALELPTPAERAAYLNGACGADPALLANVRELLATHEKDDAFLNRPPRNGTVDEQPMTERPGTVIGPYKLLQQIGEGGMGVVYMAEQEQPGRRKVALKIIKPGMDSKAVVARFEAERQALAMMDHTNIARVFDAGTTESGRPYFVMELVHGVPVTTYCDQNKLTPRERLELFVPVCQAIQHAHRKGIIHRDA